MSSAINFRNFAYNLINSINTMQHGLETVEVNINSQKIKGFKT